IFIENNPTIIIECKGWKEKLDVHNSQLFRYFVVSTVRFAILTNGIEYRFYADLIKPNIMDDRPFFEFDLSKIKDNQIQEIQRFSKSVFNPSEIASNAENLKYSKDLRKLLEEEF